MVVFDQQQLYQFAFEILLFVLIIVITAFIAYVSRSLISRALRSSSPYLAARIRRFVFLLIWAVGILFALGRVGISSDILLILLALAGIGFLVSAYPVLQNLISRSFLSQQYKVGDVIYIGGTTGKVIEITDLNTVLLDNEGNLVTVPNVLFLRNIWTKQQLTGYEVSFPFVIEKKIDVVTFEKELMISLKGMKKYFKKEPQIVTSKTEEKTTELSLILNLKNPEMKGVVIVEVEEKVRKLIDELTEKAENSRKETKLKEIKDIGK